MPINIDNIPVEPSVTVINPDGSELITTNNPTTLQYIRLQIKRQSLEGYTILTESGTRIKILSNGKLQYWTDEVPGTLFDKFTSELI